MKKLIFFLILFSFYIIETAHTKPSINDWPSNISSAEGAGETVTPPAPAPTPNSGGTVTPPAPAPTPNSGGTVTPPAPIPNPTPPVSIPDPTLIPSSSIPPYTSLGADTSSRTPQPSHYVKPPQITIPSPTTTPASSYTPTPPADLGMGLLGVSSSTSPAAFPPTSLPGTPSSLPTTPPQQMIAAPASSAAYTSPVPVYCSNKKQMGLLAIKIDPIHVTIPSRPKGIPILNNTTKTPVPQGQISLTEMKNLCTAFGGVDLERLKNELKKEQYDTSLLNTVK